MGSNSKSDDITGEAAVKELKDISYTLFKLREHKVRRSNGEFGCPFCAIKEDDPADYTHLLQHAIRVAEGSISGKQRAKHSAMAKYLAIDIAAELKPSEKDEEEGEEEEWLPKKTPAGRKRTRTSGKNTTAARTSPRRMANWQKVVQAEKRLEEALEKIRDLEKTISDMSDEMNVLITKERSSNEELQLVRKELLRGMISDVPWADETIGVLKIGELEPKVFIKELHARYPQGDSEMKGVELCSMWQDKLTDPQWYPFQIVDDDKGKPQRLLKEDDLTLYTLKEEWGVKIHDAVVNALTAIQEHNSSGCYAVPELWNFGLKRKATLDEVIRHIIKLVGDQGKGEQRSTRSRKSMDSKGM